MNRTILLLLLGIAILPSCIKDKTEETPVIKKTCEAPGALNSGKEGDCLFAIDQVKGSYMVKVIQYDLQPEIIGDSFQMDVRKSYCQYFENKNTVAEIVSLNGSFFYPTTFCVQLDEYKSHFDGNQTLFADAYLTGEANFAGGIFSFDGLIHNSDSSYRIKMMSYSFHLDED